MVGSTPAEGPLIVDDKLFFSSTVPMFNLDYMCMISTRIDTRLWRALQSLHNAEISATNQHKLIHGQ